MKATFPVMDERCFLYFKERERVMKQRLKNIGLFFLIVSLLVGIMGCSNVTSQMANHADEKEIVLAAPRDLAPGEKDAYYTSIITYVWEPLVKMGGNGEPISGLATSWEMSNDAKEWVFTLRKGVKFHDGKPVNADAIVKNYKRHWEVSPKNSPFYTLDIKKSYSGLQAIEKVDDQRVKFVFEHPQPTLLYTMENFGSPIYSPDSFAENGDFKGIPAGTGPFKLISHEKDHYMLLERNEEYYGEKAKARQVRINVIPDADTRFSALKSGEIMGVIDLGAISPDQANQLKQNQDFSVSVNKSSVSHYIHPNGTKYPFDDVRMRQAVSLLLDRKELVDSLYGGFPTPTVTMINAMSPFYVEQPIEHNPEKAKRLADEVLQGKREPVTLIVPSYGIDRYPYKAQAEWVQAMLKEIGLDASIKILDGAAFKEAQRAGDYNLALATQGLPNMDPYTLLANYMQSHGASNKNYSLGYQNAEVDALLKDVQKSLNIEERKKIYGRLLQIAAQDWPTIPLFHDATIVSSNAKLQGLNALPYGVTLPQIEWKRE